MSVKRVNIINNIIKRSKFLVLLLVIFGLYNGVTAEAYARSQRVSAEKDPNGITAQAVYAVDYTNRKVIFARNPNLRFYPASTVKLLTALVVLDNKKLEDSVVVSKQATEIAPTKAELTAGATYSVEDLLKVLLATSANDAAVALAQSVSGSTDSFAVLMNKKAVRLGCRRSRFSNPTGLPDRRQVTTAYDLSLMSLMNAGISTSTGHPLTQGLSLH